MKGARRTHDSTSGMRAAQHVPDFRVAIDFGTTFTTIAFIKGNGAMSKALTIEEFPDDPIMARNGTQVPTEIWYLSEKTVKPTIIKKGRARKGVPPIAPNVLYGYEIIRRLETPEGDPLRVAYKNTGHVTKPKLLLDDTPQLLPLRKDLTDVLSQLKEDGLIHKDEDVIEQLLYCFLRHTKEMLERDHDLDDNCKG